MKHATLPGSRLVNGAGFLICAAAFAFAVVYLQGTLGLEPCPLCMIDRVLVIAMGVVFLLAAVHDPGRTGQRVYASINVLLAVLALAVAGRHVWLQHLPADRVPACGADLAYMLENFPLQETLRQVLQGSGECAEIQWTLLGLSIPEQTLILFTALGALSLLQLLRRRD